MHDTWHDCRSLLEKMPDCPDDSTWTEWFEDGSGKKCQHCFQTKSSVCDIPVGGEIIEANNPPGALNLDDGGSRGSSATCNYNYYSFPTMTEITSFKKKWGSSDEDIAGISGTTDITDTYDDMANNFCTSVSGAGCPDGVQECSVLKRSGDDSQQILCTAWLNGKTSEEKDQLMEGICNKGSNKDLAECACINRADDKKDYGEVHGLSPFSLTPDGCWYSACKDGKSNVWVPSNVYVQQNNCPSICQAFSNIVASGDGATNIAVVKQHLTCPAPGECTGKGKQKDGVCTCTGGDDAATEGWIGRDCQHPCNNNGSLKVAHSSGNTYPTSCTCEEGASGATCGTLCRW